MTSQIAILFDADNRPLAVNPTGTAGASPQPWTGKVHDDGTVTYGRHTYRPVRSLGSRDNGEHGTLYQRVIPPGFQVLSTHHQLGTITSPLFPEPLADRDEASRRARALVTNNLAAFGTRARAELVWQEAPGEYSEPLAVLDGRNHSTADAIRARLQDRLLEWDEIHDPPEHERAEDAPPSSAPQPQSPQDIDCEHDTTTVRQSQAEMVVRYRCAVPPAQMNGQGQVVTYAIDGDRIDNPHPTPARIQRWLLHNDYQPQYEDWRWLDNGPWPRRRLEIYVKALEPGEEPAPVRTGAIYQELVELGVNRAPVITEEQKARWRAKGRQMMIDEGLDPDLPITLQRPYRNVGPVPDGFHYRTGC